MTIDPADGLLISTSPGEARTAGSGAREEELAGEMEDLRDLVAGWGEVTAVPSLLYSEPDAVSRALRDLAFEEMAAILIDDPATLAAARRYAEDNWPEIGR